MDGKSFFSVEKKNDRTKKNIRAWDKQFGQKYSFDLFQPSGISL